MEGYIYVPMAQQVMTRISLLVGTRRRPRRIPQVRALLREMKPTCR